MVLLIGLCGEKGAGKDTFANIVTDCFGDLAVASYAFAGPLKRICKELFRLNDGQLTDEKQKEIIDPRWDMAPRQMMQMVGTDWARRLKDDIWIFHFREWFEANRHRFGIIIVTDVRFQNEIDELKRLGCAAIIKIVRPHSGRPRDTHISETGIDSLEGVTDIIHNDTSLDEYKRHVQKTMDALVGDRYRLMKTADEDVDPDKRELKGLLCSMCIFFLIIYVYGSVIGAF